MEGSVLATRTNRAPVAPPTVVNILLDRLTTMRGILTRLAPESITLHRLNSIITKLQNGEKLSAREITDLRSLLVDFVKARNSTLSEVDKERLNKTIEELSSLINGNPVAEQEAAMPDSSSPRPVGPAATAHDLNMRGQILAAGVSAISRESGEVEIRIHDFKLTISLAQLIELAGRQGVTAAEVLRSIPVEATVERATPSSEILGRLLITSVVETLMREINQELSRSGEVSREAINRITERISTELVETVVSRPRETREAPQIRRDGLAAERREEVRYEERLEVRRREAELEISGRMETSRMVETARELINARPAEMLPQLAALAARVIEQNRAAQPEVVQFLRGVLADVKVTIPSVDPQNAMRRGSSWAQEPVFVELIRALISSPRAIADAQFAQTSYVVVRSIMEQAPTAALRVLVSEAKAQAKNPEVRQALERMAVEIVRTPEGQKAVLNAFAANQGGQLTSSDFGKQLVVETVRSLIRDAVVREASAPKSAAVKYSKVTGADRLMAIAREVADRNQAGINPLTLTMAKAQNIIDVIVNTSKVVSLIGPKNLAKLEQPATQGRPKVSSVPRKPGAAAPAAARRRPVDAARTVRPRAELHELINKLGEAQIALPLELYNLIGTHYAGLAGLKGMTDPLIAPQMRVQEQPETRGNSALRNILQVMEAEQTARVARVSHPAQVTAVASRMAVEVAERIVRGIIIVKVKANERQAVEMINALLNSKGYYKAMVEEIRGGNTEGITRFVDQIVLEATRGGRDLTEASVLEAISVVEARTFQQAA
jgi:hypothetical protein